MKDKATNNRVSAKRDKKVSRFVHRLYWSAILRSPWMLAATLLFHAITYILTNTYVPLQLAYGIQAIINRDFEAVNHYVTVIIVATIVANTAYAFATLAINRLGVRGQEYVQLAVYRNFLSKDYDFYSNSFSGSLGAQAANMREGLSTYDLTMVFNIPRYVVIVFSGLFVVAINSWILALITIACMALVMSYTLFFAKYRLRARRRLSQANTKISGLLVDSLSHGVDVKTFGNEDYETNRLKQALKPWSEALKGSWDLAIPQNGVRNMLMALTMALLLFASAKLYQGGTISLAIVTLVQFYVIRLVTLTADMADAIKVYDQSMAMAHSAAETMMQESLVTDKHQTIALPDTDKLELELSGVSYKYQDSPDSDAIKDVDLLIKSGEKIGIVGYSGSGKSTLTKLLLRFMDATDGSIRLAGIDYRDLKQSDLRQVVSYVPQEPLLFHRSIADNIAYAQPEATPEEVRAAAQLAYVDEFVDALPKGFDTIVGERGIKLSGGQRQRVAIARALLKDSPILVLDEATSALDSQSEQRIQDALKTLLKHRTAIVVAHRLSTIQHMDRIVVMDKGVVVAVGTHAELIKQKGIYAALWAHQSGGYIGVPNDTES